MRRMILSLILACFVLPFVTKAQTVKPNKKKGSEGSVTFKYRGELVIYTTVRAKDGNIWLKQNLGSEKVASSIFDKASYGDLYTWGRWQDGHELREGSPLKSGTASPNNPLGLNKNGANPFYVSSRASGYWWFKGTENDTWDKVKPKDITATAGVDPCKQLLGGSWRLPTKKEWEKVIRAEGINSIKSAYESNLRISMAGFRPAKTGTIVSEGRMARLWTSTASNKGNAYLVNIVHKGVELPAYSRSGGLSVRCICEK